MDALLKLVNHKCSAVAMPTKGISCIEIVNVVFNEQVLAMILSGFLKLTLK